MSNTDGEITEISAASEEPAQSNTDRLLQHLKAETLAARLVQAHKDAADPAAALKRVLMERLEQVRHTLAGAKN